MPKSQYKFQFTANADNNFSILNKQVQKRILNKLYFFEKAPDPLSYAKKLKGVDNRFSFRIGDYRIIVTAKPSGELIILVILKIRHRREVYNTD